MGALGLMYADTIAKARGRESVSFVMNKERLQKYKDAVFTCNGEEKTFQMRDCEEMEPGTDGRVCLTLFSAVFDRFAFRGTGV